MTNCRLISVSLLTLLALALPACQSEPMDQADASPAPIIVDHNDVAAMQSLTPAQAAAIAELNFYFAHASVGRNMLAGLEMLHNENPELYRLKIVNEDASAPDKTEPSTIYDNNRGNPGWKAKMDGFTDAISSSWGHGKVDVALDKLCYIDQKADVDYYLKSMDELEKNNPATCFVYMTMPIMTGSSADNDLRNAYNNAVREYVKTHNKVLLDLADIEAHDPAGQLQSYDSSGQPRQTLYPAYSNDGGHLNTLGQRQAALAWYALALKVAEHRIRR